MHALQKGCRYARMASCGMLALLFAIRAPVALAAGDLHYSPLEEINASNISHLGFAWQYKLGLRRGVEATPIVIDGVMYTSGPWGHVYALNAATGKLLWAYDPEVPGGYGKNACCDVVNRGVAVWQGRVYVASLDGFLHALDAHTGRLLWRVNTLPPHAPEAHYFVTGAPVVAGDVIVIGYGGADFKGGRGFIQRQIADASAAYQHALEAKQEFIVGVNVQVEREAALPFEPFVLDPGLADRQIRRTQSIRKSRPQAEVSSALKEIEQAAVGAQNVMPAVVRAIKAQATVGEMCNVLRGVFGEYRAPLVY